MSSSMVQLLMISALTSHGLVMGQSSDQNCINELKKCSEPAPTCQIGSNVAFETDPWSKLDNPEVRAGVKCACGTVSPTIDCVKKAPSCAGIIDRWETEMIKYKNNCTAAGFSTGGSSGTFDFSYMLVLGIPALIFGL